MNKNLIGGIVGSLVSFTGLTIEQSSLIADIVSIVCGCLGVAITLITTLIIPLAKWWKEAKKDGKLDEKEIKEASDIIQNSVNQIASKNKKEKGE